MSISGLWVGQRGFKPFWVILLVVPLPVELHASWPNDMLTAHPWTSPQGTEYKAGAPQNNMLYPSQQLLDPTLTIKTSLLSTARFHTHLRSLRCGHRTLQAGGQCGTGIQIPTDPIVCVNVGRYWWSTPHVSTNMLHWTTLSRCGLWSSEEEQPPLNHTVDVWEDASCCGTSANYFSDLAQLLTQLFTVYSHLPWGQQLLGPWLNLYFAHLQRNKHLTVLGSLILMERHVLKSRKKM